MNPSRGFLAALLSALLAALAAGLSRAGTVSLTEPPPEAGSSFEIPAGACAGRGGPAASPILEGTAFDLRAHPLAQDALGEWKSAGYEANPDSSRLLSPDGAAVPEAEYKRLTAPFDAAVDRMTAGAWSALIFEGYRLQDSTCLFLDPQKRLPATRLDILSFERQIAGRRGISATEALLAELKRDDASKPPSAAVLARIAELEARSEHLPESLRLALLDRTLTAGALRDQAENAYAEMLRSWEGSRSLQALAQDALPPVAGWNAPTAKQGRIESWEQAIGDGFSSDIQSLFSRTEAGRELLSRFTDAAGRPDMPKMTVLKMSQRPNDPGYGAALAVYDNGSRTIVLNHWYVVGQILAGVAPAEREKLAKQLSDSRALAEYLRTNPAALATVSDRVDASVFHELTHAWQYRRQSLAVEEARGNAPTGIILAREHEAFFGEFRYLHEKMMIDPSAAMRTDEFDQYLRAIKDPEGFRDQITRNYQNGIAGATDFKTLQQIQAERTSILGSASGFAPMAWTRALLERVRLARGSATLEEARGDQAATVNRYLDEIYPKMREEAARTLPDSLALAGRPDLSFKVLAAVSNSDDADGDRRPEFAAATAEMLANRPEAMNLKERLSTYVALNAEVRREKKGFPPEVRPQYKHDAIVFAAQLVDRAQDAVERGPRAELIKAARNWITAAPEAPNAPALQERLDVLEKSR